MGNYDDIGVPISGQRVSKSQFGDKVIAAINDLDRRVSGFDGSSGSGVASSTASQTLSTLVETITLTIPSFTFRAGFAYRASIRFGLSGAAANYVCLLRLRKGTSLTLSGNTATNTDYGEYFRFDAKNGVGQMSANGQIFLLRTASTDLTTGVMLTATSNVAAASAITLYANSTSPRYFVIEPAGFATTFAGLGVAIT